MRSWGTWEGGDSWQSCCPVETKYCFYCCICSKFCVTHWKFEYVGGRQAVSHSGRLSSLHQSRCKLHFGSIQDSPCLFTKSATWIRAKLKLSKIEGDQIFDQQNLIRPTLSWATKLLDINFDLLHVARLHFAQLQTLLLDFMLLDARM